MELEMTWQRPPARRRARRLALLGLAWLAALAACKEPRQRDAPPVEATSSRVDVFLRCSDPAARPLRFALERVELRDETGQLRPLAVVRREAASTELAHRAPLAGAIVPPARYVALVLHLGGAWLERPEGGVALQLVPEEPAEAGPGDAAAGAVVEVPLDVRLRQRDAASVFLEWRAAESLRGGLGFRPALGASLERPQTALGLLYVTDAASGAVLSIDRATREIVGTFKTGAAPSSLTLLRDRRRLFVANGGDGSLSLADLRLGRVVSSVPIAFGARTSDVVVADPARWVAAANPGLDSVAFVPLAAEGSVLRLPVGREPVRLATAPSLRRLYVVEQGGDSVSVIDTSTRAIVATLAVEARPSDADVDRDERELYVVHATSPNLLVFDARTLAPLATIHVGGAVTDVLADQRRSRIYVARARPPEILVVERRVGAIVMRIPVSGRVASMALAPDGSKLYAAAPQQGALLEIDVVTGDEGDAIRCGGEPTDVTVAE